MTDPLLEYEGRLGRTFFDHQRGFLQAWLELQLTRACLYFPTGKGKTLTALAALGLQGRTSALVVTPPVQGPIWQTEGAKLGIDVTAISHAKFRQKEYRLDRNVPLIVDEFHLLGGAQGMGWKKLDRAARGYLAPLLILSATPQYNDAERVYCVEHVLDPLSPNVRDGLLGFIYRNCETEQNNFGMMPLVKGFLRWPNAKNGAEEYLKALPLVFHIPDEAVYQIVDIPVMTKVPDEFDTFGLDMRSERIMASQMEAKHRLLDLQLIGDDGALQPHVADELEHLIGIADTPVLVFCAFERIAEAFARTMDQLNTRYALVTGSTPAKKKLELIQRFREGEFDVLVGTATLATGTDGLDRMCNTMILLNDTDDGALRRQLVGRILPRGKNADYSKKKFWRIVPC